MDTTITEIDLSEIIPMKNPEAFIDFLELNNVTRKSLLDLEKQYSQKERLLYILLKNVPDFPIDFSIFYVFVFHLPNIAFEEFKALIIESFNKPFNPWQPQAGYIRGRMIIRV